MAINVTFYNFGKKVNSTAQPSSGGTTFPCELIENTSISAPTIRLNLSNVSGFSPMGKTYAYIPDFQRYYFVMDWVYELGTWVAPLQVDALATAKTNIGASSQYVVRSSYEFNRYIEDSMYPVQNRYYPSKIYGYSTVTGGRTPLFCETSEMGVWYIVGIIGGISLAMDIVFGLTGNKAYNGSVVYYVLTDKQMEAFIGQLLRSVSLFSIPTSEISEELQKQLINPIQYIESIQCVPFKPPVFYDPYHSDDAKTKFYMLGFKELEVAHVGPSYDSDTDDWRILAKPSITGDIRDLPDTNGNDGWIKCHEMKSVCHVHPNWSRGDWTLNSPYTRFVIEVEPYGTIDVPSHALIMADKYQLPDDTQTYFDIIYKTWFDVATGACRLDIGIICNQMFMPFYTNTTKVSISVPCHQSIQDVAGFVKNTNSLDASTFNTSVDTVAGILGLLTLGALGGVGESDRQKGNISASTGNGVIGDIAGMMKSIHTFKAETVPNTAISLKENNAPKITGCSSAEGSFISFSQTMNSPIVYCYYAILAPDNNADVGRPLNDIRQISSIPGFIKCMSPHFSDGNLTASEVEQILSFMQGGFFYE